MANTVERFTNRVENYVKYRPNYPPEVLQLFKNEMNLQTSSVVADIGSGTGISTKIFLENGNPVFGIEPNEAMRKAAEKFLRGFPNFKSIDGTSENTMLESDSVDFVVSAQAFHWFRPQPTQTEFKRILKEKGFVVLIWNERRLDASEFLREYEKFLLNYATDYEKARHENVSVEKFADFFQVGFQKASFSNSQTFDFEGLKGRMQSSSYMPSEESPNFAETIKTLQTLFTRHAENGKIQLLYDTNIYYGQI